MEPSSTAVVLDDETYTRVIREWGLGNCSASQQEQFMSEIGDLLYRAILLRCAEIMTPAQQESFDDFVTYEPKPDAWQILLFLQEHVPQMRDILKEEAAILKEELFAAEV